MVSNLASHSCKDDVLGSVQSEIGILLARREVGVDFNEIDGADEAGGVAVFEERHGFAQRQSTPHCHE